MSIIRQICMFCDTPYGTKDGHGVSGDSHGICPECNKLTDAQRDVIANRKAASRRLSISDFTRV